MAVTRRLAAAAVLIVGITCLSPAQSSASLDRSSAVLRTVQVGSGPITYDVAQRERRILEVDGDNNEYVTLLDATTGSIVHRIKVTANIVYARISEAMGVALILSSPDTINPGTLTVLNIQSGRVIRTVSVGTNPQMFATDQQLARVYVTNKDDDSVSIIDLRTGEVLHTPTVGAQPREIQVDALTNRVFVLSTMDKTITVLDARSGHFLKLIQAGDNVDGIIVDQQSNRLFVRYCQYFSQCGDDSYADNGSIDTRDAATGKLLRSTTLHTSGPLGMYIDPSVQRLVVLDTKADLATLLDATDGSLLQDISIGISVVDVQANWVTKRLFALSLGPVNGDGKPLSTGEMRVISMVTGKVLRTIGVGANPESFVLDNQTHRAFVANVDDNTITVINTKAIG